MTTIQFVMMREADRLRESCEEEELTPAQKYLIEAAERIARTVKRKAGRDEE
jgi:hypothetical protein